MQGRNHVVGVFVAWSCAGLSLAAAGCRQERASEGSASSHAEVQQPPASAADRELERKIAGAWRATMTDDDVTISGEFTYSPDGKAEMIGVVQVKTVTTPMSWSTTWSVRDNKLIEKITESSMPEALPVGEITEDRIVRVNDEELVVVDSDGVTTTYQRASK
jgi:hypothetical protein